MKRRLSALLCAALLAGSLTACRGSFDSLDDITDEMLRSGRSSYLVIHWSSSTRNGTEYHAKWGNMNGYQRLFTLPAAGPGSAVLTYTVDDPGEGYRVVLLDADGTLTDLTEGDNDLTLPRGAASVFLAAVETSGEFTLSRSSDSGMTMSAD